MKFRAVVAAVCISVFALPASAAIRYRISVAHPERHFFQVSMEIPRAQSGLVVDLPAWNALYQIRDFSFRVQDVHAAADDGGALHPLIVTKITKDAWRLDAPAQTRQSFALVRVQYRIYWNDAGPFNAQLDAHHAFVNFAQLLFYIPDRRNEPTQVAFDGLPANWKIAVELPAGDNPNTFSASGYDAMADAPAELGAFDESDFSAGGANYRVVTDGAVDRGSLVEGLRRITAYETTLMGGAPFREYLFIFHFGDYRQAGAGGMEHANGTAIGAASVAGALETASHEFFHAWNVKRIRPQSLEPVDYSREQYTRALWFAEGVTSTYGEYTLLRSGLANRQQFYADLAAQIGELQSRPARLWKSVEEASLDAWLEKYEFYGRPDISISYYNKGQILGDLLDLTIRDATDNHQSLDDVLRRMNTEYALRGKFYDDTPAIRQAAEQVAGRDLGDFFSSYVSGTAELPYDKVLALAGLQLRVATISSLDLGFDVTHDFSGHATVSEVAAGSPAEAAGLSEGDVLVTLNGQPFPRGLSRWPREHSQEGGRMQVVVERNGVRQEFDFSAATQNDSHFEVAEMPDASGRQLRIREGWLGGVTGNPAH